eukprot:9878815-Alexandrium_andersonii.AAC.1
MGNDQWAAARSPAVASGALCLPWCSARSIPPPRPPNWWRLWRAREAPVGWSGGSSSPGSSGVSRGRQPPGQAQKDYGKWWKQLDTLGYSWKQLDTVVRHSGIQWDTVGYTWIHLDTLGSSWKQLEAVGS